MKLQFRSYLHGLSKSLTVLAVATVFSLLAQEPSFASQDDEPTLADTCTATLTGQLTEENFQDNVDIPFKLLNKMSLDDINGYLLRKYKTTEITDPNVKRIRANWANKEAQHYLLHHGKRTKHSVLLIHSMGDSSFYTRQYGEFFYSLGYNVIGLTLPGHGYDLDALADKKIVDYGHINKFVGMALTVASQMGDEIIGFGHGFGAAIVLNRAKPIVIPKFDGDKTNLKLIRGDFKSIILLSPTLNFQDSAITSTTPDKLQRMRFLKPYMDAISLSSPKEYRYTKIPIEAFRVMHEILILNFNAYEFKYAAKKEIPKILTLYSEADKVIDHQYIEQYLREFDIYNPSNVMMLPKQEGISHLGITRTKSGSREDYPFLSDKQFERIRYRLQTFLFNNELMP